MNDDFIKQINDDFIPRMEKMLDNEMNHLNWLISYKKKKDRWYGIFFKSNVDEYIIESDYMIQHLTLRIFEYKDYVMKYYKGVDK